MILNFRLTRIIRHVCHIAICPHACGTVWVCGNGRGEIQVKEGVDFAALVPEKKKPNVGLDKQDDWHKKERR